MQYVLVVRRTWAGCGVTLTAQVGAGGCFMDCWMASLILLTLYIPTYTPHSSCTGYLVVGVGLHMADASTLHLAAATQCSSCFMRLWRAERLL